jgi:hypothetical protein
MFRLTGLDPTPFESLFALSDAQLRERGIQRRRADAAFGYPCRVSLEDALEGEQMLLLPWRHHDVDSPYQASGPIYVRRGARRAQPPPGHVPDYVRRRLISLRAYDAAALMVTAEVTEGAGVAARLAELFRDERVGYVHLHNARPGCYSCAAVRS